MRKLLSIVLVGLLVFFASLVKRRRRVQARTKQRHSKDQARSRTWRGRKSAGAIKLRNGQRMKGYVSSAAKVTLLLPIASPARPRPLPTPMLMKSESRLSKGAKIGIAVGIAVGVLAVLCAVVVHSLNIDINGIRIP